MNHIALYAIASALLALAVWCGVRLSKESIAVHQKLDEFLSRAKATSSRFDLMQIRRELVQFHIKECVFRQWGDHSREVLRYIDGRLDQTTREIST